MVHSLAKVAALISLAIFAFAGCTQKSSQPELRIFTWSEYFDNAAIQDFEKATGVKVKVDYFSSNEQLLTKLQLTAGNPDESYDLVLPSDYLVRTLVELKLLHPIDKTKLTVLKDFDPSIKTDYDPGMTHSVPMAIGTTGIAVNTKLLPRFATEAGRKAGLSWKEMLENPEYKGKVTLIDDIKEVVQIGLHRNGKHIKDATDADVKAAFAYLAKQKPQLRGFTTETRPVIEADECSLCMVYSGDALSVAKGKPEIQFFTPTDGTTIWTDNLAIPANARSPELAYKFMNHLLSPEVAKRFTERTGYRTPSLRAKALLPKDIVENPVIYPRAADVKNFYYLVERKDLALLIDKEWAVLKSQ